MLATKTANAALQAVTVVEEDDASGFVAWQRLEKDGRGFLRQRVNLLTRLVINPEEVAKAADITAAYYKWGGHLKEFENEKGQEWRTHKSAERP